MNELEITSNWEEKKLEIINMENIDYYNGSKIILLIIISFLVGFMGNLFFINNKSGYLGISAFIMEFVLILGFMKLNLKQIKYDFISIFSIGVLLLMSLWFGIFSSPVVASIYFILLVIGNSFIFLYITGYTKNIRSKISSIYIYIFSYLVGFLHIVPTIRDLNKLISLKSAKNKTGIIIKYSLVLFILLTVIITLLSSADEIFGKIVVDLFNIEKLQLYLYDIFRTLLGGLIYLSCIIYFSNKSIAELKPNIVNKMKFEDIGAKIILYGINFVYALFIVIQIKYLFMGNIETINQYGIESFSEYAHKGFWELIIISSINFSIYYFIQESLEIKKSSNTHLRLLLTALLSVTIIILISATIRISFYVLSYGLTHLRFFVYYGIFFIFCLMILGIINIYLKKIDFNKYMFVISLTTILIIGYGNLDLFIGNHNYNRAINNDNRYYTGSAEQKWGFPRLFELDHQYLNTLSSDAYPIIIKINNDDEAAKLCNHYKSISKTQPVWEYNFMFSKAKNTYCNR